MLLYYGVLDTVARLNGPDEVAVAHVVVSMLQFRMVVLQVPL